VPVATYPDRALLLQVVDVDWESRQSYRRS
jgi:hypothetical protein